DALSSPFTYQGQLQKSGVPVSATCTFQFTLFDAPSGGSPLGTLTPSVVVTNGVFSVPLDFGAGPFNGAVRFLQVAVSCPGDTGFPILNQSQLQQLTAAPYALFAAGAASANNLACSGCVGTTNLADGSVTDPKVANGISYSKLSGAPSALPP